MRFRTTLREETKMQEKEVSEPIFIKVQADWLKSLLKLSKKCELEYDKEHPMMPVCFYQLAGFSSSAESILKYGEKTK